MASSSGGSSGSSTLLTISCMGEDLQAVMDKKKRKRILSNRESARRSRLRKDNHLKDLTTEISLLREKNGWIRTSVNLYAQNNLVLESENSVLRTQLIELTSTLNSLNDILQYLNLNNSCVIPQIMASEWFFNPWSSAQESAYNGFTKFAPVLDQDDFFPFLNDGI